MSALLENMIPFVGPKHAPKNGAECNEDKAIVSHPLLNRLAAYGHNNQKSGYNANHRPELPGVPEKGHDQIAPYAFEKVYHAEQCKRAAHMCQEGIV